MTIRSAHRDAFALRLGQYEDQSAEQVEAPSAETADEAFVIPEDLSELDDDALFALEEQAMEHFNAVYGEDGQGLSDEDLEALASLTEGIEALSTERERRENLSAERAEKAREMAGRVGKGDEPSEEDDAEEEADESLRVKDEEDTEDDDEDEDEDKPTDDDSAAKTVTASGKTKPQGERRINLSGVRSRGRQPAPREERKPSGTASVMFSSDAPGIRDGEGMDFDQAAKSLDRRLGGMPLAQYESAARMGRNMREQHSLAVIRRPYQDGQVIKNSDPDHVSEVLKRATDERNLPQNSLVASGGWCAPSEILYDNLLELESSDGLFSLPEVGVARGGFQFTRGPSFNDIYAGTGFSFTEQQDIDGNYGVDEDGVGDGTDADKPCYKVDCPPFEEVRLDVAGLCVTAGLLQARGYPEVIARTLRGALVAHDHKMAARLIGAVVAGSDAVTMPGPQVGALAPLLSSIELQVEHFRYTHRIARSTTLEAVFPLWVHGAVRSDLSHRLGVDMLSVPDARINAWFSERGIAPQFVYNWQDITGDAADFTAWPTEVQFLLYPAGTWVRGSGDIITLDTIYDSVNLGRNNYTALFTEEAWLVARMGIESRVVTVPIDATGATAGGVLINHNGTAGTATE